MTEMYLKRILLQLWGDRHRRSQEGQRSHATPDF